MNNKRLINFHKLKFEVRDVMRYDDVGDYFADTIVAYDFQDDVITNAIFLHEFIEYMLIKSSGIEPDLIDKFDIDPDYADKYPREYELYSKYHNMANKIERQFVENLGLRWEEYDRVINTKKVRTAMQKISDELHKEHPDEKKIERSKKIIQQNYEE